MFLLLFDLFIELLGELFLQLFELIFMSCVCLIERVLHTLVNISFLP